MTILSSKRMQSKLIALFIILILQSGNGLSRVVEPDTGGNTNDQTSSTLHEDLAPTLEPRTASELVKLCTAADADRAAYCMGYLEAAIHYLKMESSCMSEEITDGTYCQGAKEAQEKIDAAIQSCKDCDFASFRPDIQDNAERFQLFTERMENFRDELEITLGTCKMGGERTKNFCAGFNAEKNVGVSMNLGRSPDGKIEKPHDMGVSEASLDLFVAVYASSEFHAIRACVPVSMTAREAKDIVLEFVRENPEQQIESMAILLVAKALFYNLCQTALSQEMRPHVEQCVQWSQSHAQPGVRNICDKTIVIVFMLEREFGPEIKTEEIVIEGGQFHEDKRLSRTPWRSTACPEGYVSSIPFTAENLEKIRASDYGCVKEK